MNPDTTIYADYQASTPIDRRVAQAMAPYWQTFFGNPHSSDHVVGWKAAQTVQDAAATVGSLIGADPDEIVFTSGATEANNLALLGLARRRSATRNRILVTAIEHKCVLASARAAKREGCETEIIPVDDQGFADLSWLSERLDETVLAVSVMAVNNEVGTIQDIPRIAALLLPHGICLHCDAAQAPCALDLRELSLHADLVSLSGHKMYGPQGVGALYIRREIQDSIEPLFHGGSQQHGLRSGTVPVALCIGLAAAVECLGTSQGKQDRSRVMELRDRFVHLLQQGSHPITVNGADPSRRHPGNANLRFHGFEAHEILGALQPRLAASTGAACSTGIPEPSHVLRALGLNGALAESSIRFSFGRFTTEDEVVKAAAMVKEVLDRLAS